MIRSRASSVPPILKSSLNRVAVKAFHKISSCGDHLRRRLTMVFPAHVFLLLVFMFLVISFPSSWTEHSQKADLFSGLPCICENIVILNNCHFTNCVTCSDFITNAVLITAKRHDQAKPFSLLPLVSAWRVHCES